MKKLKLFASLMSMCFALAILCFGVYASYQTNYTLSGSFSYNVNGACVSIITRVFVGPYRSGDAVYDSIHGMVYEGDSPYDHDYTLSDSISIPTYNSITYNGDFDLSDVDIVMDLDHAVYVFELEIKNIGELDIWIEPKPNWDETLNVYQANSGVTTCLERDEVIKTYIILALDNYIAPIEDGTYEIGLTIDTGDCPINDYYSLNTTTHIITGNNVPAEVIIPSYIDGEIVEQIPDDSGGFAENEDITTVHVPGSVKSMGDAGFCDCPNLTTLRIEKGVSNITNCSTFYGSGVENFRFPNTLNVTSGGDYVDETPWLEDLWDNDNGIAIASDGITTYLLSSQYGELVDGTILDYSDCRIDYICGYCFIDSSITQITLPRGVKEIGMNAFANCTSLAVVNLSPGLKKIDSGAFDNCTSLNSIVIPEGVEVIDGSFSGCTSLSSVTLPNTLTRLGYVTFYNTPWYNNLTYTNGLSIVNGKYLLKADPSYNFGNLTASSLSGIQAIYSGVFYNCSGLTSIELPDGLTVVEFELFNYCSNLTTIVIPSTITVISNAFYGCTGLTSITVNATKIPQLDSNAFNNTNNCPIYVPSSRVTVYERATNWSTYASRIYAKP